MLKFGKTITKNRKLILVISILLLIPSVLGMIGTRINYDVLCYLPDDIETMKGQEILLDEFGKGGFSMVVTENLQKKDVAKLKEKIEKVDHVDSVIWYDSLANISVPYEILPDDVYESFNNGDSTVMAVFFDTGTSADETIKAVDDIRSIGKEQCYVSGMSAFVADLKNLTEKEEPVYVTIAVILACIVLAIFLDSWIIPFVFIAGIGMSILYNLGTNFFLGEISYITKALSAVLQLGVTMDYSIFLWHSYEEELTKYNDSEEAMSRAIANTLTSVSGSSVTTIAGFLALCFMTFTLGKDLGIVMAKGVLFGVIGCVTILPTLILTFEKIINKTRHNGILPKFDKLTDFVINKSKVFAVLFIIILVPAVYGYSHTDVYYNLDKSVPQDLPFKVANNKLEDEFGMSCTHMLLVDANIDKTSLKRMLNEIDDVPGVGSTLGVESVTGATVPLEIIPNEIKKKLISDNYQLMVINSKYKVASDEMAGQIDSIKSIVKKYDKNAMLIGEAPCTNDLISITDKDFKVVNFISIFAIFIIIALVFKSISLPIILISVIEFAIFINLGIPCYTGTVLPFIASICISTIQLGATVDYAILMTTRYKRERSSGKGKKEAIKIAHQTSMSSVAVSALGFFAATFGVGLYSKIDIIGSLCGLMARGAIISLLVVMFILPAAFMIFDKVIIKTSKGFTQA